MAQHHLASPAERTFTVGQVANMTEKQAFEEFQCLRWNGLEQQVCPYCGSIQKHLPRRHRKQWVCKDCGKTFSLTTNTLFADHKLSFKAMLLGIAIFLNSAKGVSALQLSRELGVTPKTANMLTGKLREGLVRTRDLSPLKGLVQIDGGQFGGKPRRPNRRQKISSAQVEEKLRSGTRKQIIYATKNRKNRRVVMIFREVHQKGQGAGRSIVSIAMTENPTDTIAMARRFISREAVVMSDESNAFADIATFWRHETVNHSVEYSTKDGVNDNQAESFFSRLRRWEYGISHRVTPKYLMDRAEEMVWRENLRRSTAILRLRNLADRVLHCGLSVWWRRYHQGQHRQEELLLY